MTMLASLPWLWMPRPIGAAFAQTLRTAAQRHLTAELGTLGAALVRFLYGLPFAVAWLLVQHLRSPSALPDIGAVFMLWVACGAVAQIAATALLLQVMADRNFALGVAYSKTEVVQAAVVGVVLPGAPLSPAIALWAAIASVGVALF